MDVWIHRSSTTQVNGAGSAAAGVSIAGANGGEATAAQRRWSRREVAAGLAVVQGRDGEVALEPLAGAAAEAVPMELARVLAVDHSHAALLGTGNAEIRLNGHKTLRVAVLADRDEITVMGGRLRFAAFADAGPYVMGDEGYRCGRCKRAIEAGSVVHECAGCGAVYHSREILKHETREHETLADEPAGGAAAAELVPPCYSYEPECRICLRAWTSMCWDPNHEDARR